MFLKPTTLPFLRRTKQDKMKNETIVTDNSVVIENLKNKIKRLRRRKVSPKVIQAITEYSKLLKQLTK